ncbi:MAG: peptide-methionine (S)-S-oxide reductase MsrA [Peptostreptococcaceae bacterium]|nr:peptide-methionine (S)-S-oxide reductase MsrA [Peptostreptococcaceae bacterium]
MKSIYFAGGCFWGVEEYFSKVAGVIETEVGYANGKIENPTYEDVCHNFTGHAETVKVSYDERLASVETLLAALFRIIDPTLLNRQGPDRGAQYRTGVYSENEDDLAAANEWIGSVAGKYKKPVQTEVLPLENYSRAEEYHQKYLKKNSGGYCHIDLDA